MLSKSSLFNLPNSLGTGYFRFLLVYHQGNGSFPHCLHNPLPLLLLTTRAHIWTFNLLYTATTATSCHLRSLPSLSAPSSCPRLLAQPHSGTSARLLPSVHPIQLFHLEFSSLCAVHCFNTLLLALTCATPFEFPTPPNPFIFFHSAPCLSYDAL